MLFLLNDVVFKLDPPCPAPLRDESRFEPLDLDAVIELACELFSEHTELQHSHPERARRLAWLLAHVSDGLNAALFTAPEAGCDPDLVEPRFCMLPQPMIRHLDERASRGGLTEAMTHSEVWGLIAA